jgi:xanthine dehydrogenase accessory factor
VNIFSEIISALQTEEKVMLATVIATSGSTPASSLSKMLVKRSGSVSVGTVGGGSMEHEVAEEAKRLFPLGIAKILTFHLKEDELMQGLICGGNLDVLIEPIGREQLPLFQQVNTLNEKGQDCFWGTIIQTDGTVKERRVFNSTEEANEWIDVLSKEWKNTNTDPTNPAFDPGTHELQYRTGHQNEIKRIRLPHGELIIEPVLCTPDLFIFGGGHIGKALCALASDCGFRVVVIDDREQYAQPARFPKAAQILAMDFLRAFDHISVKSSSYIVIATHGHRPDEEILERSLRSTAGYIGMIGSRRKIATIYERLQKRGVSQRQMERVYAPIGVELGAVTPEEIAVSIVAQLIRVHRKMKDEAGDKSELMYSFFHKNDVLS